jgi:two-component system LytT family sensor kinase
MRKSIGRFMLAALAWTAIGAVFALPNLASAVWRRALLASLTQWWCWGLVSALIVAFDRRLPFSERQLPRRIAAHFLPSLIFTCVYVYVFAAGLALVGLQRWNVVPHTQVLLGTLRGMFLWSWLVYWLILGGWQVHQYYGRYLSSELRRERLERSFSEAR